MSSPSAHVAGSRPSLGRVGVVLALVPFLFFLAATRADATDTAGTWDILPNLEEHIPSSIADLVDVPGWDAEIAAMAPEAAEGVAAAGAGVVAIPGEIVAGAVLGTGVAMVGYWKIGGVLGKALPCFTCSGVASPPTSYNFSNGVTLTSVQQKNGTSNADFGVYGGTFNVPAGFCPCYYSLDADSSADGTNPGGANVTATGTFGSAGSSSSLNLVVQGCHTPANSCGVSQYPRLSGACFLLMNSSGSAVYVRRPMGLPRSGCSSAVGAASTGSTTGLQQTPTSSSGGSDGHTPDNTRQLVARSTSYCRNAAGSVSTVVADSAVFYESTPDSARPPITAPACPEPLSRVRWTVVIHPLDGLTADRPLIDTGTLPTTAPAAHPEYAPCLPGGSAYPCKLTLLRLASNGATRPYDPASDYTPDVSKQPDKFPDSWRCEWGPLRVAIAECRTIYQQVPVTRPDVDTDPDSVSCKWHLTRPWTWPFTAIKCAFVPPPGSLDSTVTQLQQAWDGSAPAVAIGMVTGLFTPWLSLADGGDCAGPQVSIPIPTQGNVSGHPFSTCPALISWLLSIALPIETVVCGLAAVVTGSRILAATFGAESPV